MKFDSSFRQACEFLRHSALQRPAACDNRVTSELPTLGMCFLREDAAECYQEEQPHAVAGGQIKAPQTLQHNTGSTTKRSLTLTRRQTDRQADRQTRRPAGLWHAGESAFDSLTWAASYTIAPATAVTGGRCQGLLQNSVFCLKTIICVSDLPMNSFRNDMKSILLSLASRCRKLR